MLGSRRSRASLVFATVCCACVGAIDDPPASRGAGPPDIAPDPTRLVCDVAADARVSIGELRRLSRDEYEATLRALLPDGALASATSHLSLFPGDATQVSPGEFAPAHTREHVTAIFEVAMRAAEAIVADPALLSSIAPCITDPRSVDDACLRETIASAGLRFVRRPLADAEVARYVALYHADDEGILDEAQRLELVFAALLNAPELVFHVTGTDGAGRVEPYTLASRISYATTGGPPDSALFEAARSGALDDAAVREEHARRLLDSPAGRTFVRSLFRRWLALDAIDEPQTAVIERAGIERDGLVDELREEALAFVEHVVFDQRGSFQDLLRADVSFPASVRLGAILGAEVSSEPVSVEARAGLLARPALLLSPNPRSNPIHRGATIVRRMLCREISPPPANADMVADSLLEDVDPTAMTSREVTETMTAPAACATCHGQLNAPGFALEAFGPLGELRATETTFDELGEPVRDLPIDDAVESLGLDDATVSVRGAVALGEALAASDEATACAAVQVFRTTHLREPRTTDACHIDAIRVEVRADAPFFDVLIANVLAESTIVEGP